MYDRANVRVACRAANDDLSDAALDRFARGEDLPSSVVSAMSVDGSFTSRRRPATFVRMRSASASIATAMRAATRSPSTFTASFSVDSASGATTGTRLGPMNWRSSGTFTAFTVPV